MTFFYQAAPCSTKFSKFPNAHRNFWNFSCDPSFYSIVCITFTCVFYLSIPCLRPNINKTRLSPLLIFSKFFKDRFPTWVGYKDHNQGIQIFTLSTTFYPLSLSSKNQMMIIGKKWKLWIFRIMICYKY